MLPSKETLQVQITDIRDQKGFGTVELQRWDKKERTMRALKTLGGCWGLAIFCIFLPIIHFIMVPLLILAGPIVAGWIYNQEQVILGGKGECPNCHKEIEIVRTAVKWPISDLCNHCNSELKITQWAES